MNKRRMKRRIASLEERLFQSQLPPPIEYATIEVQVDVPGGPEIIAYPFLVGAPIRQVIDLPAMGYVVRRKS